MSSVASSLQSAAMAYQGSLKVLTRSATPAALCVFDDGLVVIEGSRGARAGLLFGAIGGLVAARSAQKALDQKLGIVNGLGPTATSDQAAASVENATAYSTAAIASVDVTKGIGKGRKLKIEASDGRSSKLVFNTKQTPTEEFDRLVRPLLGDRLHGTP